MSVNVRRLVRIGRLEDGDGHILTEIDHPPEGWDHKSYGLLVCDLVRHIAKAFKVEEDDVWEWVDKERHHHTTDLKLPS